MSYPVYGRYQAPEPPHLMGCLHLRDEAVTLKPVDWEPKVGVLDQSDLLAQGIRCSTFIPGAGNPDALGSCTANGNTSALSNLWDLQTFVDRTGCKDYQDVVGAEKFAITFYHECSDQTGDPSQEWPPTDCGSSGPYIVAENKRLNYASGCQIAHGADNIVSLMQSGGLLVGQPFLNAWEEPGPDGMIDGNGSVATVEAQIRQGVAGGHETYISAVETLVLYPNGVVNPWETIIRLRNSWSKSWGDNGSYRAHLSTYSHILAPYCDFRGLIA